MKKLIFLILLLGSSAASAERPTMTVQVDPLTTALGFVHVQFETKITDHFSIYAGPSLRLFNGLARISSRIPTSQTLEVTVALLVATPRFLTAGSYSREA